MISFRFHLVSLVAVFLALGVGILTGTTVINQGLVARLEAETDELSAEVVTLREESSVWNEFGEGAMAPLLTGRLAGQQVILVTQDGTSQETLEGARESLEVGGAEIIAQLSAGPRMVLSSEADREAMSSIVGMDPGEEPLAIATEAAQRLGRRLADGPNGSDVLERLLDEEFLVIQGAELTETSLRALGGSGQVVVAVVGGPAVSELDPSSFLIPLVTELVAAGMPVAAGEPAQADEQEPPFVTVLRAEGEISSEVATQDNLDQIPGQVGLVLAIEDLLLGEPGHYGVKDGASQTVPDLA